MMRSGGWAAIGLTVLVAVGPGCGPSEDTAPVGGLRGAPERAAPAASALVDADAADLASALEEGLRAHLQRVRAVERRAGDFEQHGLLASLGENPHVGAVDRLDDRLEEARIARPSGAAARATPQESRLGAEQFEWIARDGWTLVANRDPLRAGWSDVHVVDLVLAVNEPVDLWLGCSPSEGDDWQAMADEEATMDYRLVRVDIVPDGRARRYRVLVRNSFNRHFGSRNELNTIFLRVDRERADAVELVSLEIGRRAARFEAEICGREFAERGQDRRPVLYCRSPAQMRFRVDVPEHDPRLRFGVGLAAGQPAVTFSASVEASGREERVYERTHDSPQSWHDASVDLSPWAGQKVVLTLGAASAAESIALWTSPRVSGAPTQRLNVLLILEDTLRADHLSGYGHARPTSPAKDELARRGVLFESAFSQATVTIASVPSMMASLPPVATGVYDHFDQLGSEYVTLAEILRAQGFETASIIQNPYAGVKSGSDQGFSQLLYHGDRGPEHVYGELAPQWIEQHRDRNFFLYLHVTDPHGPYDPPAPWDAWAREVEPGPSAVPRRGPLDPDRVAAPTVEGRRLRYDGEIRHNDEQLAGLLDRLESWGLLRDTLVVFVSDHGEHLGEHGLWAHHPPSYRQVVHVPLLMMHPGLLPSGVRIRGPVALVDVAPTVLELAGVECGSCLHQGDSLVPHLGAPAGDFWRRRLVWTDEPQSYAHEGEEGVWGSVFLGRWHLLQSPSLGRTPRVFDYLSDPEEISPLQDARLAESDVAALLAEVKEANLATRRSLAAADAVEETTVDPEMRDHLRALGYLEDRGEEP